MSITIVAVAMDCKGVSQFLHSATSLSDSRVREIECWPTRRSSAHASSRQPALRLALRLHPPIRVPTLAEQAIRPHGGVRPYLGPGAGSPRSSVATTSRSPLATTRGLGNRARSIHPRTRRRAQTETQCQRGASCRGAGTRRDNEAPRGEGPIGEPSPGPCPAAAGAACGQAPRATMPSGERPSPSQARRSRTSCRTRSQPW
jgi:hypothetical protein